MAKVKTKSYLSGGGRDKGASGHLTGSGGPERPGSAKGRLARRGRKRRGM